jgi:hypothetical protein
LRKKSLFSEGVVTFLGYQGIIWISGKTEDILTVNPLTLQRKALSEY